MAAAPKAFPVSWDQFHRDCKVLAWRLAGSGKDGPQWSAIVAITRGGLVPAAIIARELGIRTIETVCIASYHEYKDQGELDVIKGIHLDQIKEDGGRGVLVIDDTDKQRSKKTTKIAGAHKVKDKKTGGYFNGQELIFMVLVTDWVTFPVGFRWYRPDPELKAWRKENKRLKREGIPRNERPPQPAPDPDYPSKQALALAMVEEFTDWFSDITVTATLADALYGTAEFMDKVSAATGNGQVVSQLRRNQLVFSRGRKIALSDYFARQAGVETQLTIRGGAKKRVTLLAARLQVKAHGKRRFVVALKYEGETDYRFLVASDLSWRHHDIATLYTLRWLVEVFIQDWKAHAGWDRLTKHQGVKGSTRGVILSLLCDHLLLLHPEQSARIKNKQPGISAGCLIESLKAEALVGTIEDIIDTEDPTVALATFTDALRDTLEERSSSKHMAGRDTGRLESTPSLRYREAA